MDKRKSQGKLRDAVRRGMIQKSNYCESCMKTLKREMLSGHHHHGYDFPLDVLWVCQGCHSKIHNMNPNGSKKVEAKLTEEIVRQLRRMIKYRGFYSEMAKQHKVAVSTVRRAVLGEKWKAVVF